MARLEIRSARPWRRLQHALAVLLGVLLISPAMPALAANVTIKLGIVPIGETLPLWVGRDEGFFKEEGIELELIPNAGGAVGIPAMEGGSLHMQFTDVTAALKAVEQGLKLRFIAPAGIVGRDPARDGNHFLVLKDSPFMKLSDLKGQRVASNVFGNLNHLYLLAQLDQAGLKPDDYRVVEIAFPQMLDALLNKNVALIYGVEPFKTIALNSGKVRDLGSAFYRIHPNIRVGGHVTLERWLGKNEDTARRFQRAYFRSADFVNKHRDRLGDWYVKYFRLSPNLKDNITFGEWRDDTTMGDSFLASMTKTRDLMVKYGWLKTDIDVRSLILMSQ